MRASEFVNEGIFDRFKKKAKPTLDLPRWPNSNNANEWMAAKAEYYAQHDPENLPTLFSPATGDYLPLSIHVGSSWKPEHQAFYRELKKKYPEAVEKAKEITTGLAGRVSLSRVGDDSDFHGMSISESYVAAKPTKRQSYSSRGLHKFRDPQGYDRTYEMNRIGMALACTDGEIEPDVNQESWAGRFNTSHPYTDVEDKMLKKAYKAMGSDYTDLNGGDLDSEELGTINAVSPVAKRPKDFRKK